MTGEVRQAACRAKLIEIARARKTITYKELADHLGTAPRSVGKFLTPIYQDENSKGHPDVTLVVVSAGTGFGKFNSQGGPACSKTFDPKDPADVQAYKVALAGVYDHWSGRSDE